MADQEAKQQASDDERVSKDGYDLTFYPGFASRCVVRTPEGREIEMYRQTEPFRLPPGQTRPRDRYRIHLEGGAKKQDVSFEVYDPRRRVKRITVELYPETHEPDVERESGEFDTLTLDNDTIYCPPFCDQESFERRLSGGG